MTHSIHIAPKKQTFGHGSKPQKAFIDIDVGPAGDILPAFIGAYGSLKSAVPGPEGSLDTPMTAAAMFTTR